MSERALKHEDSHTVWARLDGHWCKRCERFLHGPCDGKGCAGCEGRGYLESETLPTGGMTYFLVGKEGINHLEPGKSTLIRMRRSPSGGYQWSYLYHTHDEAWQKKYASEVAHAEKRIFWGNWQDWDMVKAGGYPSVLGISEDQARALIDNSVALYC